MVSASRTSVEIAASVQGRARAKRPVTRAVGPVRELPLCQAFR